VDIRFAGGRREWNAQGREVPEVLGPRRDVEMVPINPTHHIDERRLQHLREKAQGVQQLINAGIVRDVDGWATELANVADRNIEVEAFESWFHNQITVMDPKTGQTVTVSVGIAADRYIAAALTLAGEANAYLAFMGYLRDARAKLGSVGAVRMRQNLLSDILVDAPAFSGDSMSLAGLQARMNAEGFGSVTIVVDERTYHAFTDGGSEYTTEYYVPFDRMAFQPANGIVGQTHFAPVTRAYDYMDMGRVRTINDFTIFHSEKNDGKTLLVEAQANALSLPTEQSTYVVHDLADEGS
jgi:hypothetical protein